MYSVRQSTKPDLNLEDTEMDSPLINKLMNCAKAIADGDLKLADFLFGQMEVLVDDEANEAAKKVVKHFAEALARRVHGVHPKTALPLLPLTNLDYFYEVYPFEHIADISTQYAIQYLPSIGGRMRVHVIDFSIRENTRFWRNSMRLLPISSLQLTTIRIVLSRNGEHPQDMHQKLTEMAQGLHVDFKHNRYEANSVSDIVQLVLQLERNSEDETLIVRWTFELHKLLAVEGAIEKVLSKLKDLNPDLMVIIEQEADHNISDFFERFCLSFQYYFGLFKSLLERNVDLAKDKLPWRWEMHLRRQISNIVASEGIDRIERHETLACWQKRLGDAAFESVPLYSDQYQKLEAWSQAYGYKMKTENGVPVLFLNDHPLIFISTWKPTNPAGQSDDVARVKISDSNRTIFRGGDLNYPITIQDDSSPPIETQVASSSDSDDDDDGEGYDPNTMRSLGIWSREEVRNYLVSPLTEKESKRINRWMCRQMTGKIAGCDKNLNVCDLSLASLLMIPPPEIPFEEEKRYYVDDSIINAFFKLLGERSKKFPKMYIKNYSLPTWIMSFLLSGKWSETKVLSCLKIEEIKGTSKLFIPVCLVNHWILICVDIEKRVLLWLDSLNSPSDAHLTEKALISKWVTEHLMPVLGYHDANEWQFWKSVEIPYQTNRVDCGIFVMKYADCLVHREDDYFPFTQQDMPRFRHRIFLGIYRGKLHVFDVEKYYKQLGVDDFWMQFLTGRPEQENR